MYDTVSDHIDETRRRAFESAWAAGTPLQIEDNLPAISHPGYLPTLEELIHIDLEFAWKQANTDPDSPDRTGPLVEDYLARFPAIIQPGIVRRLLQQEFYVRRRHGDRPAVDEYCSRFPELWSHRHEAATLLEASDNVPLHVGQPTSHQARYRLVARHARGGFGEVWRATDAVLGREVAIKRLARDIASHTDHRRRFTAEARIAARLEHPGVVPVYDLVDSDGEHPYYAMRFLSGATMAEAVRRFHAVRPRVSLRSVPGIRLLSAFVTIAKTIQFAHARGVIHRDLKPQNIMLGDYGETIILDWGLAKDLRGGRTRNASGRVPVAQPSSQSKLQPAQRTTAPIGNDAPAETVAGAVMGTPAYMSPEQFEGRIAAVDERSDVYGLGAILYELLTGVAPHASVWGESAAQNVVPPPRTQAPLVPRPLEAICLRALAADPADRYQDAAALIEDMERYLADEPVSVWQESWPTRLARFTRRHRTLAAATGCVVLSAVLALASILVVLVRSNRELSAAHGKTEAALVKAEASLYLQRLVTAHQEFVENNNVLQARALLDQCPIERRHWEWHFVSGLCDQDQPRTLIGHQGRVQQAVFSPDDQLVASVDDDGNVLVWDAARAEQLWRGAHKRGASCIAFSTDGTQLASGGVDLNGRGTVMIWDARSGDLRSEFVAHQRRVTSLTFSPAGNWLATGSMDDRVKLWNASTLTPVRSLLGHDAGVLSVAFDAESQRLVSGSQDSTVKVWEVASGALLRTFTGHTGRVAGVAFSPNGKQIASAGEDGTVRIWNMDGVEGARVLSGHRESVECLAFSRDGQQLASGGFDSAIHVWNLSAPDKNRILRGHESHIRGVAFNSDGTRIVSSSDDFTARLWDLGRGLPAAFPGQLVAFHPNGRSIATADVLSDRHADVRVWDLETQQEKRQFRPDERIHDLQYSHDGRWLACAGDKGTVMLWDANDGNVVQRVRSDASQNCLAFSPNDDWFIVGDRTGKIRIWSRESTAPPRIVHAHDGHVTSVAFSPHGDTFASTSMDRTAKVFDRKSGTELLVLQGHEDVLTNITFNPSGTRLATSSFDGTIRLWDSQTGDLLRSLTAGKFYLNSVVFSPDGKRIASGSDQIIKIWDTSTGHQVFSVWGHNCVSEMAFSPNGEWLAVAGTHKHIRLLRGAPSSAAR